MGAAKYSYNMCNETSDTENINQRPTEDSNSNETSRSASSSYHLAPMRVATNVVGAGLRLLRNIKPSSKPEPPVTSTDQDCNNLPNNEPEEVDVLEVDPPTENANLDLPGDSQPVQSEESVIILEESDVSMDTSSDVQIIERNEERFYERALQEEYNGLSAFVEEILPASDDPRGDLIEIYKAQINDLHQVIKLLESELTAVKLTTSRERTDLVSRHEEMMEQIEKEHQVEIASLNQQHWELVDEIIRSQIDEIELWKLEFVSDSEKNGDTQAAVPTKNQKLAVELMGKFKELNTAQQGLVVVGMGVVTMAVGYYSWPFMVWAWPRLIAFAARVEVASVAAWLFTMMNSAAFKDFMKAWEDGEPLGPAFFNSFGSEIRSAILSMAPKLFRMGRTVSATTH